VATAVDIVVHVETTTEGRRRVSEIIGLPGRVEGGVIEISELYATVGGILARANGLPPHPERFVRAGVDLTRLLGA
jgi:pilus assembly protein CpaF